MTDTTTRTEQRQATLERYEAEVLDGTVFMNHANSHRSRYGYQPVCSRRTYARAVAALAEMAADTDPLAQIAHAILGAGLPLYGTEADLYEALYRRADAAIADGYTDVVKLSGPEPGRRSDAERSYTLAERIQVLHYLAKATGTNIGWCLQALTERDRIRVCSR